MRSVKRSIKGCNNDGNLSITYYNIESDAEKYFKQLNQKKELPSSSRYFTNCRELSDDEILYGEELPNTSEFFINNKLYEPELKAKSEFIYTPESKQVVRFREDEYPRSLPSTSQLKSLDSTL